MLQQGSLAGAAKAITAAQETVGVMSHAINSTTAAQILMQLVALDVSQTG